MAEQKGYWGQLSVSILGAVITAIWLTAWPATEMWAAIKSAWQNGTGSANSAIAAGRAALTYPIQVPAWSVIGLVVVGLFVFFSRGLLGQVARGARSAAIDGLANPAQVRERSSVTSKPTLPSARETNPPHVKTPSGLLPVPLRAPLNEIETDVLRLLMLLDGTKLSIDIAANALSIRRLQLTKAFEVLSAAGFIDFGVDGGNEVAVRITPAGRDYCFGEGVDGDDQLNAKLEAAIKKDADRWMRY